VRRLVLALAAFLSAGLCVYDLAAAQGPPAPDSRLVAQGRALYEDGCSSCHGLDARGIPGRAPSLRGVGEIAADFYLSTGRMPLDRPGAQPVRAEPAYPPREIRALVAFVGSFGGPRIPQVDPAAGDLAQGQRLFTSSCAGCHQIVGAGGMVTRAAVPDLKQATPRDVAEAVRIGPYLMPPFSERQLDRRDLDSLARYVQWTHEPEDRGGWGIGHLGPIPEGMVAWLLGLAALILTIRLIGERTPE
jgi:ubiquinol-cytochrome c reductase cytochrome c subunit